MASAHRERLRTRKHARVKRPSPIAWVRQSVRSRNSRPTWNRPEPSPKRPPSRSCHPGPGPRPGSRPTTPRRQSILPCKAGRGAGRARRGARGHGGDVRAGGCGRVLDRHGRDSCSMRWGAAVAACQRFPPRPDDPPVRERGPGPGPLARSPATGDRGPGTAGHVRGDTARVSRTPPAAPAQPRASLAAYVPLVIGLACLVGSVWLDVTNTDAERAAADIGFAFPGGPARGWSSPPRPRGCCASGRTTASGSCPVPSPSCGRSTASCRGGSPTVRVRTTRWAPTLPSGSWPVGAVLLSGLVALLLLYPTGRLLGGRWRPVSAGWCRGLLRAAADAGARAGRRRLHHARARRLDRARPRPGHRRSGRDAAAPRAGAHPRVHRRRGRPPVGPPPARRPA